MGERRRMVWKHHSLTRRPLYQWQAQCQSYPHPSPSGLRSSTRTHTLLPVCTAPLLCLQHGNMSQILNTHKFDAILFNDNSVVKIVDPVPDHAAVAHLVSPDLCVPVLVFADFCRVVRLRAEPCSCC